MKDRKTLLITQVFMTCTMAFAMSGFMSLLALGPTSTWLEEWPREFLVAWPTAFVLTFAAWPVASGLTRLVLGERAD